MRSWDELRRHLLARIGRALVYDEPLYDPKDPVDRIYLVQLQELLPDVPAPPQPREGRPPPDWLQGRDEAQVLALLVWEVRKSGKRGAVSAVVRRFAHTNKLTAKEEGSLRVRMHTIVTELKELAALLTVLRGPKVPS